MFAASPASFVCWVYQTATSLCPAQWGCVFTAGAQIIICSTCLIEGGGEEEMGIARQSEFWREQLKTHLEV